MEFDVTDRLMLLDILPREGDYTTLKIVRELRDELSFSEDEHQALKFENRFICPRCHNEEWSPIPLKCPVCKMEMRDSQFKKWDDVNLIKEIPLRDKAYEIISAELRKLNENHLLADRHIKLYEAFVENEIVR